jgi:predicted alpha-1,6-mannanase (GH76 family)
MKKSDLLFAVTFLIALLFFSSGYAQISRIKTGEVYTIKSRSNNKLLDVSNSSMDNNAAITSWTDTYSDAQRWVVSYLGKGIYTFRNMASGKMLHISSTTADSFTVDQSDSKIDGSNWVIKSAGSGSYYIKPVQLPALSLSQPIDEDKEGAAVILNRSSPVKAQRWVIQKDNAPSTLSAEEIADKAFESWYSYYKMESGKGFWDRAEMMEVVLDAYEVTKDVKYIKRFDLMYKNFITENKSDWMYNNFNDDIAWAVLFSVRGYLFTDNKAYLEKGKEQFDKMYARAFTNKYGGGLNWFETKTSKNSCIQGPAMVAACYLAEATGDKTYYDKAIALYSWSKIYLFDAATGKVNDAIDLDQKTGLIKTSTWSSTYNQGTFLGAATMLYQFTGEKNYLIDAEKIAIYARDNMYKGKTMNNEEGGNDLPGFKGIFARYARMYTIKTKNTDLVEWLNLNGRVAYNNRNSSGIIHTQWGTRTSETKPGSPFGASTAVSLLINTLGLK